MIKFSKHISEYFPPSGLYGLGLIKNLSRELVDKLQPEEIVEMDDFTNEQRKREYLSSRLLLKEMAYEKGMDGGQFRVLKDDLGKPHGYYKNRHVDISIAHTDTYVLCGLASDFEIGVDLEPADRKVTEDLHHRILHTDEMPILDDLSVLQIWTMKEALIKLEGSGLRINMNDLAVRIRNNGCYYTEFSNDKIAKICNFKSDNHWISIAYYAD